MKLVNELNSAVDGMSVPVVVSKSEAANDIGTAMVISKGADAIQKLFSTFKLEDINGTTPKNAVEDITFQEHLKE